MGFLCKVKVFWVWFWGSGIENICRIVRRMKSFPFDFKFPNPGFTRGDTYFDDWTRKKKRIS